MGISKDSFLQYRIYNSDEKGKLDSLAYTLSPDDVNYCLEDNSLSNGKLFLLRCKGNNYTYSESRYDYPIKDNEDYTLVQDNEQDIILCKKDDSTDGMPFFYTTNRNIEDIESFDKKNNSNITVNKIIIFGKHEYDTFYSNSDKQAIAFELSDGKTTIFKNIPEDKKLILESNDEIKLICDTNGFAEYLYLFEFKSSSNGKTIVNFKKKLKPAFEFDVSKQNITVNELEGLICCAKNKKNNRENDSSGDKYLSKHPEDGIVYTDILQENNIDVYYYQCTVYGCDKNWEIKDIWTEDVSLADVTDNCNVDPKIEKSNFPLGDIGNKISNEVRKPTKKVKKEPEIYKDDEQYLAGDVISTIIYFTDKGDSINKKGASRSKQRDFIKYAQDFFNKEESERGRATNKTITSEYLEEIYSDKLTYKEVDGYEYSSDNVLIQPFAKLVIAYQQDELNAIGMKDVVDAFRYAFADLEGKEWNESSNIIYLGRNFCKKYFDENRQLKNIVAKEILSYEKLKLQKYKVNSTIEYVYNRLCVIARDCFEKEEQITQENKRTYLLNTYFENMTNGMFNMLVALVLTLDDKEKRLIFDRIKYEISGILKSATKDENGVYTTAKELNFKKIFDDLQGIYNKKLVEKLKNESYTDYSTWQPLKIGTLRNETNYDNYAYLFQCFVTKRCKLYSLSLTTRAFGFDKKRRVATIIESGDEATYANDLNSVTQNKFDVREVEKFIQTWMVKGKEINKDEKQYEIPIENYYDMYSNMTPYVQVGFRDAFGCVREGEHDVIYSDGVAIAVREFVSSGENGGKYIYKKIKGKKNNQYEISNEQLSDDEALKLLSNCYTYIDTIKYPYISNMKLTDKGVKNLELTLIDPDFASYQKAIESNGKVFSLETLIRGALIPPTSTPKNTTEHYEGDEFTSDYLKIDNQLKANPTNLKLRFGYANYNQNIITENNKMDATSDAIKEHYKLSANREGRWWDVKEYGIDNYLGIDKIKKYVVNGELVVKQTEEGGWNSIANNEDFAVNGIVARKANETSEIKNNVEGQLQHSELVNSWHQTASMSRELDFMITGFSTSLTKQGIQYNITAIESKDASLCNTRFLQRYAEITTYPEEVLYILMRMFNEADDGTNIKTSNVKIVLMEDTDDEVDSMKDKLNQRYDKKKLTVDQLKDADGEDTYSVASSKSQLILQPDALQTITLSLGGNEATRNYKSDVHVPLYKTVSELMNEFCAACPPKKAIANNTEDTYDENGNKIIAKEDISPSRPLKWFSAYDDANGITYVCLYYRRTKKVPKIRVYTWGPRNPTLSCVKNISISNSNEFAILSGIKSFDGKKYMARNSNTLMEERVECETNKTEDSFLDDKITDVVNIAGINSKVYEAAFSNSMYQGSIEVLGDPFYTLDGIMQPYTYPIKLNVVIPQNEFTQRRTNPSMLNIEQIFGKRDVYNGSYSLNEKNTNGNQRLHEMSGYYVITDVTHEINSKGFTTKLGVMSYPNIQKDVLIDKS